MTASSSDGGEPVADVPGALVAALAAGTREAFMALLAEDVHWGGVHGGDECTNREQAGDHYAGLLAAGVSLQLAELPHADPGVEGGDLTVCVLIQSPEPGDFPAQVTLRLTLRDALIADIRELDLPAQIEVLYFDGCPHFQAFLPHLNDLLSEHSMSTQLTLTCIANDADAQAHEFPGSPTVRVNGRDVEPDLAGRQRVVAGGTRAAPDHPYGMQCRLYSTGHPSAAASGTSTGPRDEWILDALTGFALHEAAIVAIHSGDLPALQQLLAEHPDLAVIRLPRHGGRTLLHIATDWPGHYPDVGATIAALAAAGADPNVPSLGEHPETPLHWAASSDDVAALDALLDAGADINALGAVIAGGTPLADATAFGQWNAARRLLERGAATNLFEAATLGLLDRVQLHLDTDQPTPADITSSFWGACHGGHQNTAAVLLERGAGINWIGYDGLTPLDAARRSKTTDLARWLEAHGATSAAQPGPPPGGGPG